MYTFVTGGKGEFNVNIYSDQLSRDEIPKG